MLALSMITHFPPARNHSDTFHTCNADKAWLAAEGLVPVADDFLAPGFISAQLVGGIIYKVHSMKSQHLGMGKLSAGRKLFDEHGSAVHEPPCTFLVALQPGLQSLCNNPFEQNHPGPCNPHISAPFCTQAGLQMAMQACAQTYYVLHLPLHLLH